ncbi:hypothetical protein ACT7DL_26970 [Bacillus paranthracis]
MKDDVWNFLADDVGELNEKLLTTYNTLEQVLGEPKAGVKTGRNPAYILTKGNSTAINPTGCKK